MPPPPVTPSPHRFVIKEPQRAPPSAVPRRQQQWDPIRQASHTRQTERRQFNATPRFSFAASQRSPAVSPVVRSLIATTTARVRPGASLEDVIDDVRDEENGDVLLDAENDYQVRKSIEASDAIGHLEQEYLYQLEIVEGDSDLPARDPKRRRLSSSSPLRGAQPALREDGDDQEQGHDHGMEMQMLDEEHIDICEQGQGHTNDFEDLISSANTAISSPPQFNTPRPLQHQPSTATTSNAPRFRFLSTPRPAPLQTPQAVTEHQNASFTKPPRFRPPAEEEQTKVAPGEPLPDAFSPQRRGQKFLPGELASEVVGWVMNLESNTTAKMETNLTLGSTEEKWLAKMLIDEVRGGGGAGMTLIRGRLVKSRNDRENAPRQNIILAGAGASEPFRGQSRVEAGKMVGIKGPVWEVMLEGQEWGVAVTWAVLD